MEFVARAGQFPCHVSVLCQVCLLLYVLSALSCADLGCLSIFVSLFFISHVIPAHEQTNPKMRLLTLVGKKGL